MAPRDEHGLPSALKGWLSDIYFPALVESMQPAEAHLGLARRLGNRAVIDDPLFGRSEGMEAIEAHIAKVSSWLIERGATYQRHAFTTGTDRDVTEGTLTLQLATVPVAVVAEKRRSREVELRVYFSTAALKSAKPPRAQLVPPSPELSLPATVYAYLEAVKKRDLRVLLDSFESDGALRDGRGGVHTKADDTLRAYFERRFGGRASGSAEIVAGGFADDGRTCALEYTLVGAHGRESPPLAAAAVFERGDSGLIRTVRMYDELDP